ncbi:MAG: hypothetical protein IJQ89_08500 [Bacteroidales bacterium]|nr:hypothetical protein [Bacteroidales bacterium]MBQ6726601.1 hypothetical protein [Bacteroidales bacterium]
MKNTNTNIFYHATKELSTDAFIVWLFYFLDSDNRYETAKQELFDNIVLKEEDRGRPVSKISLERQKNNVDVFLSFIFSDDESEQVVLFEDKTRSSYHGTQLEDYKNKFPNCYRYLYLKLAYINVEEKQYVSELGYDIVTAKMISSAIKGCVTLHPIIQMYYEYINESFINLNNSFHNKLFKEQDYSILWGDEAQKYLCDIIVREMDEQNCDYLEIRNGTSYGRPWTQIDIKEKEYDGGSYWEKLFWRVDIRSDKFYIRLNLYSEPKNEYEKKLKMKHRDSLRQKIATFPEISNLIVGNVTNKGVKECEIVIFFLEDNDLNKLIGSIPSITKQIANFFSKLKWLIE